MTFGAEMCVAMGSYSWDEAKRMFEGPQSSTGERPPNTPYLRGFDARLCGVGPLRNHVRHGAVTVRPWDALDDGPDARRAPRDPPAGPHADVHAGHPADPGVGDRRECRDLQHRQHGPPQAPAVPRCRPPGGPLADGARRRHRRPQRVARRLHHLPRGVADAGRRRTLEPRRRHRHRPCPARAPRLPDRDPPPFAPPRRPADDRPAVLRARRPGRQPGSRHAEPRLLATPVRRRHERRRPLDHRGRHAPRDHRRAPEGLLVHGRPARSRAAAALQSGQRPAGGLQLPGDRPPAPWRRHRGRQRGRGTHDPRRVRQVPAAPGDDPRDDGRRTPRAEGPPARR